MNEYRPLTNDEISLILPALVKCGIQNNSNVFRFIDTKLDKLYDVYLLDQGNKTILKKTTPAEYAWLSIPVILPDTILQSPKF